jgi:hydroxymethylpyrimidine/phosphomethylpyrimidine kinase
MQHKCLSIAGFDGSGGAGLQADLKTFSALGCYGMTVLTALPVQNTQGVRHCYEIPVHVIEEQLDAIFDDIIPDSIKIGMLFKTEIIELLADFLKRRALGIPVILDPVMVAKSGDQLLMTDAIGALKQLLIPQTTLITPNIPEATQLIGIKLPVDELAEKLLALGSQAVLLKGGHLDEDHSTDIYIDQEGNKVELHSLRLQSKNTHGTGCTLSAAIAALVAQNVPLIAACRLAKQYLFEAIRAAMQNSVGKGHGPVHHFHDIWPHLKASRFDKMHEPQA